MSVIEGDFGKARIPEPPEDLNEAQGKIWRAVIASEPPDYFDGAGARGMLADYCQRREAAQKIGLVINSFRPEWIKSEEGSKRYKRLLRLRDREVRAVTSLATKLRLTNQSRLSAKSAGTAARNYSPTKPWDL